MAAKKTKTTTATSDDRNKALTNALAQIEKDFGKGAIMRLGDDNRPPIQAISSGNTAIDIALVDASLRCMALSPPVKPL